MLGPVMRALVRHVEATADDAFEMQSLSSGSEQWLSDVVSSTRSPSSADGGLSSFPSPTGRCLDGADGEEMEWPEVDETDVEFNFDDGFSLPPPALGLEELGMSVALDDAEETDLTPNETCSTFKLPSADATAIKVGPGKPASGRCQMVSGKLAQKEAGVATVANIRNFILCPDSAVLSAIMEHWANPARRDAFRRGCAVRVGRRRVALRQRPTPSTSRRCQPCGKAR